ncbi:hypothetical protein ACLB2K_059189 [Fragaria x ananassa]
MALGASIAKPASRNMAIQFLAGLDLDRDVVTQSLLNFPTRIQINVLLVSASKCWTQARIWTQIFGPAYRLWPGESRLLMMLVLFKALMATPESLATLVKIVDKERDGSGRVWD